MKLRQVQIMELFVILKKISHLKLQSGLPLAHCNSGCTYTRT
uniref:Uncharacterized protein n=1 Tax=Arundo donax TaxID=35708 RepID=A0A0A8XUK8_ARUDO